MNLIPLYNLYTALKAGLETFWVMEAWLNIYVLRDDYFEGYIRKSTDFYFLNSHLTYYTFTHVQTGFMTMLNHL